MIISFSGLDGAGKSTQISRLLQYFNNHGLDCRSVYDIKEDLLYHNKNELTIYKKYFSSADIVHTRFRMNSEHNNTIMQTLEYGPIPNEDVAWKAAAQGYLDYTEWHTEVMNNIVSSTQIVIYDRCQYDEYAYKSLYGVDIAKMYKMYSGVVKPDVSIYLSTTPQVSLSRNSTRTDSNISLYNCYEYVNALKTTFDYIAKKDNLFTIDGEQAIDTIHSQILRHISQ